MNDRFEQLVDRHGGRIFQLARLMLGCDDEAADVVQDTLVKLWRHLPQLEAGRELPWLVTCTRNACLDLLRGRTRTRSLLRLVGSQNRVLARRDHGPDERLDNRERIRELRDALDAMPEPARTLLILRDIQDMDVATVARTLNLNENQVKVYTFRARRALRRRLEEEADEQVA